MFCTRRDEVTALAMGGMPVTTSCPYRAVGVTSILPIARAVISVPEPQMSLNITKCH